MACRAFLLALCSSRQRPRTDFGGRVSDANIPKRDESIVAVRKPSLAMSKIDKPPLLLADVMLVVGSLGVFLAIAYSLMATKPDAEIRVVQDVQTGCEFELTLNRLGQPLATRPKKDSGCASASAATKQPPNLSVGGS